MNLRNRVILLLTVVGHIVFAENRSQITLLPTPPVLSKARGDDVAITCLLDNNLNAELIANFRWLDPKNRTIDINYTKINARFAVQIIDPKKIILIINKLTESDQGIYTCATGYDTRSFSVSKEIKLYIPITFTDAPTEQSATLGTLYHIKCKILADPSPQLTWQRNGEKLVSNQHYTYDSDGLIINNVQEYDDGDYICEVLVSETGEYQRRTIHLEVTSAPVIQSNLTTVHEAIEGEQTSIKCSATGKPKPSISWIRVSDGKNLSVGYDGHLHIDKVTKVDDSEFKCVAENKAGRSERTVKFNVLSKPEIFDTRNGTASVGGSGLIECFVRGNPLPKVYIRKQGISENNEVSPMVEYKSKNQDTVNARLNFQKVERNMDGLYECVAKNTIATHVNEIIRNLHFTVEFPPTFEKAGNVKEVVTWNEKPVNLTCIAESIPNATITWYHNNNKIPVNINPNKIFTLFGTGPKSILQVTPLEKNYYGIYKCVAKNLHGDAFIEIFLKEAFPPGPLSSVKEDIVTATTVTFRFGDPTSTGNMPIKGYRVQYTEEGKSGWINHTWPAGGEPYILENLNPLTTYTFRFAVLNEVGASGWDKSLTIKMPEVSSPSEPIISNPLLYNEKYVKSSYATKIELHWNIPSNNGAEIDKYNVKYCRAKEEDKDIEGFIVLTDTCQTIEIQSNMYLSSYTISDLKQNSIYKVSLLAHNDRGYGQPSSRYFKTNDVDEIASTATDNNYDNPKKMETGLSSAVIIYIVVAILIGLMVIIDVFCFFFGNTGILRILCDKCCGRKKQNDDKLGSESKDLISNGHKKMDNEEQTPMIVEGTKKETAIKYDLKKGVSRTGFVGKDSAV